MVPSRARFQRRIDKVEGQGRTIGGQSQHKSAGCGNMVVSPAVQSSLKAEVEQLQIRVIQL